MTAYYPTCPTCTGPLLAHRPGSLEEGRRLRLTCGDCGRMVLPSAWRTWVRS